MNFSFVTLVKKYLLQGANSNYNVMLLTHGTIFSINPSSGTSKESFIISVLNSSALDYEEITNFTLEVSIRGNRKVITVI